MEINITDIPAEVQQAKMRFGIVGNAPALIAAVSRAIQVAPIDLSVLITGESGTGKEFFPQIIHAFSARKHSKYIAVNCGAIPEGTIDSELFGHEKGAFTGAVATRKGYFEEADGGTIFLDEVAELPLTTQARLLRVLESGEFIKVGSSTVQKTNIRVVAATNVDMIKAIEEGRFREDLYYRLSTVNISIPPLRDRGSDIGLLARKFAADFAERYRMPQITFDESARLQLQRYRWPGNVRQLKNVTEQVALFCAGETVTASMLEQYLPDSGSAYSPAVVSHHRSHEYERERELLFNMIFRMQGEIDALRREIQGKNAPAPEDMPRSLVRYAPPEPHQELVVTPEAVETVPATLEETEKETIRRSLENNGGRRKATARELNISERTLYRKIKEYGLE
ncbi:MAG: sigma-54 dependent transcriptional regulator [Paramuribaculum sp.]|nr:sigma-54 dependent transcriptional regulator [Paramuribaculum sp.]